MHGLKREQANAMTIKPLASVLIDNETLLGISIISGNNNLVYTRI